MRKQMKIAAVVSAAALLALGASITSFAAQRGTWKYEDGEWYCYDKDGYVYENTFCLSMAKSSTLETTVQWFAPAGLSTMGITTS